MLLIALIFICILFVGFFSGIEIAFISANKLNVELKRKQNHKPAQVISRFMEHPEDFIGTSLVGVNLALIAYGAMMTRLTEPLVAMLQPPFNNSLVKLLIDTGLATFIILILGEFLPKALFKTKAEKILYFFYLPVLFFYKLLYPIATFFVTISEWILKYLFGIEFKEKKEVFSRIDLEHFVKQLNTGHDEQNNDINTELFENALYLSNVKIRECLIPRKEIEAIEVSETIDDLKQKFIETKLSKILVYDESIDNVVGYVHHLDMHRKPAAIKDILHKIITVPETMSAVDLMNLFTKERKSIAWVIDEFGGTEGIITMEDLLEEIFGEIHDEHDVEEFVEKQISKNEFILSGRLELDYLNKKFDFNFSDEDADTLSGYIIANHETIPEQNDKIVVSEYEFTILSVTDTKIDTVKLRWLKEKD